MATATECTVCMEQFDEEDRCPRLLACGHTFCHICLTQLLDSSAKDDALTCPKCRQENPVPNGVSVTIQTCIWKLCASMRRNGNTTPFLLISFPSVCLSVCLSICLSIYLSVPLKITGGGGLD